MWIKTKDMEFMNAEVYQCTHCGKEWIFQKEPLAMGYNYCQWCGAPGKGSMKSLIKDKCMTARRFAKKVGLTESSVSKILSGDIPVTPHLDMFAYILDVDRGVIEKLIQEGDKA